MRCIEACPTDAIVPNGPGWALDARRCISYLNIELRGPVPEEQSDWLGPRVFGCDICQEVCPWNSKAPETSEADFRPRYDPAPSLEELAALSESGFRDRFRNTPVMRAKYDGFRRNVELAMRRKEDDV
jgi:epoxyqueuosine reductase